MDLTNTINRSMKSNSDIEDRSEKNKKNKENVLKSNEEKFKESIKDNRGENKSNEIKKNILSDKRVSISKGKVVQNKKTKPLDKNAGETINAKNLNEKAKKTDNIKFKSKKKDRERQVILDRKIKVNIVSSEKRVRSSKEKKLKMKNIFTENNIKHINKNKINVSSIIKSNRIELREKVNKVVEGEFKDSVQLSEFATTEGVIKKILSNIKPGSEAQIKIGEMNIKIKELANFKITNPNRVSLTLNLEGEYVKVNITGKDNEVSIRVTGTSETLKERVEISVREFRGEVRDRGVEVNLDVDEKEEEEEKEDNQQQKRRREREEELKRIKKYQKYKERDE